MEPKDKAKELVNKFIKYARLTTESPIERITYAIKCATIAVDEIRELIGELNYGENGGRADVFGIEFWNQVKEEIQKL